MGIAFDSSVTVIMPAYNAQQHIRQSLQSVLATSGVTELVVVNDQSTDGTASIVNEFIGNDGRVKMVEGPSRGISAAFNAGLMAASSAFVCRCDADDLLIPDRFEVQLKMLKETPELIAVSGAFLTISDKNVVISKLASGEGSLDVTNRLLRGDSITHFCTWLTSRAALLEINGAREWFETAEDLDLQFRLAGVGRVWHDPKEVYSYRIHGDSITHSQATVRRTFYESCSREFAQQRQSRGSDLLMEGQAPTVPEDGGEATQASDHVFNLFVGKAWVEYRSCRFSSAISAMMSAVKNQPTRLEGWRGLFVITLKSLGGLISRRGK